MSKTNLIASIGFDTTDEQMRELAARTCQHAKGEFLLTIISFGPGDEAPWNLPGCVDLCRRAIACGMLSPLVRVAPLRSLRGLPAMSAVQLWAIAHGKQQLDADDVREFDRAIAASDELVKSFGAPKEDAHVVFVDGDKKA